MSGSRSQEGWLSRQTVSIFQFCGDVLIQTCWPVFIGTQLFPFTCRLSCSFHPAAAELNNCSRAHKLSPWLIYFWKFNFKNLLFLFTKYPFLFFLFFGRQRTFTMMKTLKEAWILKDRGLRCVCISCDCRLPFFSSHPWDWFNTGFETQTLFSYPSIIDTISNAISPNQGCFLNINWGTWFSKATDLYLNFLQEFSSNKYLK